MFNKRLLMHNRKEKIPPLTDLSYWSHKQYPDTYGTMTSIPESGTSYLNSIYPSNITRAFENCVNLTSVDASGWNLDYTTSCDSCFAMCYDLVSVDTTGWTLKNAVNLSGMFMYCGVLENLNVSNWDTKNVTNLSNIFEHCNRLSSSTFSGLVNWDTSNVTNMTSVFGGCDLFNSWEYIDTWDFSNVTSMRGFISGTGFTTFIKDNFNISNCNNLDYFLDECNSLQYVSMKNWTTNLTECYDMFYNNPTLRCVDISGWNTPNLSECNSMFEYCNNLEIIDMSGWTVSSNTYTGGYMFGDCTNLKYLILNDSSFKFNMTNSNCSGLNSTCKILVPSSILSTYRTATNWSSKASQFDAIENYTITKSNGQITVTPK